jgi:UPF0042 nucleotide-binding protein
LTVRIVIVTGLSGAGKSTALRALEDLGFYCADNLPLPLVAEFAAVLAEKGIEDVALSVDARQHAFLDRYDEQVQGLKRAGFQVEVLFLEAPDEVVARRYSETRRKHPLSGHDLLEGVRRDRDVLAVLRADASVLNTEHLHTHELKGIIAERFGRQKGEMALTLQSFGFKHGVPSGADLVFDVRFLPNPFFEETLNPLDGRDAEVSRYVLEGWEGKTLVGKVQEFLEYAIPEFVKEGKLYLTVAIGCTGGRHRSVAVVEELAKRFAESWKPLVRHRDLSRGR